MDCVALNVERIGISLILDYFRKALSLYDVPIISIGSGCAAFEKIIQNKLDIEILCIDPDPLSYASTDDVFIQPEYPTVEDMIEKDTTCIGNCILFISNAEPTIDEISIISYDYDAIQLLKPLAVISIYDPIHRVSGSNPFIEWVGKNEEKVIMSNSFECHTAKWIEYNRIILLNNKMKYP